MDSLASAIRAWKTAAFLASVVLLSGCAGGGTISTGSLPAQTRSEAASSRIVISPYIRTLQNGTTIHVHPLPAARAAFQSLFGNTPDRVEYHGGPVVRNTVMYSIFWRPAGTFMDDKYEPVINEYFRDVGNTEQYEILTQYYDSLGNIANASRLGGTWTDTAPYPKDFNRGRTGDDDLHAEVLKAVAVNGWPHGGIAPIYVIFTSHAAPDDRWAACAYHGSFASDSRIYVYAILPYQHDYGPHGCGTPSNTWPNDRDADQTIDTLWHEQAEAASDPNTSGNPGTGGWFSNRSGEEIGDLCQTSYGKLRADGSDTTLHDHNYVTQEMWSNLGDLCLQNAK